jgi:hypothetical protein
MEVCGEMKRKKKSRRKKREPTFWIEAIIKDEKDNGLIYWKGGLFEFINLIKEKWGKI